MVGLCSKSYCTELFATENSPAQVKFSMKAVNKGQFKEPHATLRTRLDHQPKFQNL